MSEETFGQATRRWCPLAAQFLGWAPDQFWTATPREMILSLSNPTDEARTQPPSRAKIMQMMERDHNG